MSGKNLSLPALRRLRFAFWQRRVVHWLVRAVWLSLLVPVLFIAGYLWRGWLIQEQSWVYLMLLVGFLSLAWSMRPIKIKDMADSLDSNLKLHSRFITAFEVSAERETNSVAQSLLQQTVRTSINIRRRIKLFDYNLWLEIQALIAVSALLASLLMIESLNFRIPAEQPAELALTWKEPTADDIIPPKPLAHPPVSPDKSPTPNANDNQIKDVLKILADALRDKAATHSIALSVDGGDLQKAAGGLRRLADQLDTLSQNSLAELESSLQEAADNIGNSMPDLTTPLQNGSSSLRSGNLEKTKQSLVEVAKLLEEMTPSAMANNQPQSQPPNQKQPTGGGGEQPQDSMDSGDSQGKEMTKGGSTGIPPEEERLSMEGKPLELQSDPDQIGSQAVPVELNATASNRQTNDSPFARQPFDNTIYELGADPLVYPWEKRGIIRSYFTP